MKNLFTFSILFLLNWSFVFAQGCPNTVSLNSQQEVDAFPSTFPDCSEISGSLVISDGTNIINNLDSLKYITQVNEDLRITNCDNLVDLSGLENLTVIGEDLLIRGNGNLENFNGLNGLTSIGTQLTIRENSLLEDISALSMLSTELSSHFRIETNPALASLDGLQGILFVGGDFILKSNHSLTNLVGLDGLTFM